MSWIQCNMLNSSLPLTQVFTHITHRCSLYKEVGCSSSSNQKLEHGYIFLYKAILAELPPHLWSLLTPKTISRVDLQSCGDITYVVPQTCNVSCESTFEVFAASLILKHVKLDHLLCNGIFIKNLKDELNTESTCPVAEHWYIHCLHVICCGLVRDSDFKRDSESQWEYYWKIKAKQKESITYVTTASDFIWQHGWLNILINTCMISFKMKERGSGEASKWFYTIKNWLDYSNTDCALWFWISSSNMNDSMPSFQYNTVSL